MLFELSDPDDDAEALDIATRALSVTSVEAGVVEQVYENLASVYDYAFGPMLEPGRVQGIQRMGIKPGDRVLEVGVGTGINASLYPRDCEVTGVDLSRSMLEKARNRIARMGIDNLRLLEMDAADLKFADGTFDAVFASYVISVVPDPIAVVRQMFRVCRPGGRVIFVNHFRSPNRLLARLERMISPLTVRIGFKSDLDLPALVAQANLKPASIEMVNVPRIWSLVTCIKD